MQDKLMELLTKVIQDNTPSGVDPKPIAEALYNNRFDIYAEVEKDFLRQDCEGVAKDMGVSLTKEEVDVVLDDYMQAEEYVSRNTELWEQIISHEKGLDTL